MATAQDLIDEVRYVIHDTQPTSYRWTDVELLDYLNAGLRQTVALVPEANTVETIADTGTTRVARQSLPAGGIKFIKVSRNYADDGTTPQGVVRYVEKDALDTYDPDWEYDTTVKADGTNFFEHYCHDKREPHVFYLYPVPAANNKRFALVYSANPSGVSDVSNDFPLADEYINALVMYMIYRSLTKESRDTLPDAYRQELWSNYLTALGLQREAADAVSPKENSAPEGD